MHTLIQAALKELNTAQLPPEKQQLGLELLMSEVIAFYLPLPSAPVDAPDLYFLSHCKVLVMQKLAYINERSVIQLDRAAELVFSIWLTRYSLVHRLGWSSGGNFLRLASQSQYVRMPEAYKSLLGSEQVVGLSIYRLGETELAELAEEFPQ